MESNVRLLRKKRHISQTKLGKILGVSQQMISRIEKDRDHIQIKHLIMMSEFFGVSTDYILNYYREGDDRKEEERRLAPVPAPVITPEDEMEQLKQKLFQNDDRTLFYLLMCMESYMQQRRGM